MPRQFSLSQIARSVPIQKLHNSTAMSENNEDCTVKSELCDDSTLMQPDSVPNPLICYDSAQISDLNRSALHAVNMHLHITFCVKLCRPPVEEAPYSSVADSGEFIPETLEDLMMLVEEFVPEMEESSMGMVKDAEAELVKATEIKAQGEDWRDEVANSMLQILLSRYFELVRSNPAVVLPIVDCFLHTWNLTAVSLILPFGIFPSLLHSKRNSKT